MGSSRSAMGVKLRDDLLSFRSAMVAGICIWAIVGFSVCMKGLHEIPTGDGDDDAHFVIPVCAVNWGATEEAARLYKEKLLDAGCSDNCLTLRSKPACSNSSYQAPGRCICGAP